MLYPDLVLFKENCFNQKPSNTSIFLDLYKVHSGSRRSLLPNKELLKHEISSVFPFLGDNFGLPGSGSTGEHSFLEH